MNKKQFLSIEKIHKSYKDKKIINEVSIKINSGNIIGLLGPNGAGKTSFFRTIIGATFPDKGKININNNDITLKSIYERSKLGIGFLPQETSIFNELTVEENIMAILQLQKKITQEKKKKILENLLNEFNINHIKKIKSSNLSGGEKRRVEIARCLANKPSFILLDEPFSAIDPISIVDIKNIIKYLSKKEIGIIITDHNVREILDICNIIYIMNKGKIIANGTKTEILKNQLVKNLYLGKNF